MRLFLHIGTHKTGTSAVQASLVRSEERLHAHGILYPKAGRVAVGGHLNLCWEATGDQRFSPNLGTRDDLLHEAKESSPDLLILSAETLTTRPGKTPYVLWVSSLAEELQVSSVSIIGFVRPQWDYLVSVYAQQIKMGNTVDEFDDFLQKYKHHPRFDYEKVFDLWYEKFGSALSVRPYGPSVVSDVWSWIGVGNPPPVIENARPGAKQLEMLRLVSSEFASILARRKACAWLRAHLGDLIVDERPFQPLGFEDVNHLAQLYSESNTAFARSNFFTGPPDYFLPPAQVRRTVWSFEEAVLADCDLLRTVTERCQRL